MSDSPLTECPQCGETLRRLINGGSGVIFKGSGVYVTDKQGRAAASTKGTQGAAGEPKAEGATTPSGGEKAKTTAETTPSTSALEKKKAG
jgi:predicted nucleic acid-binding Zn ribbon protein